MNPAAIAVLVCLGECHRLMKEHAGNLRSLDNTSSVTHNTDIIPFEEALRLEEYVECELPDGNALSWCFETTIRLDKTLIEADVRIIHSKGQDVIFTVADCEILDHSELKSKLLEVVNCICDYYPNHDELAAY
ncbi:MAG: hypothetical protein QM811_04590 [Pirellulales bacterium]